MANRTVKEAKNLHGTNPQYLVEKIIRSRIYDCQYWKEQCFALTAELLVDKAMELRYIGGVYGGNIKPSPFLCLVLKMLQIQPEKDIIIEFIKNEDLKYVRVLGAYYLRLTGSAIDCYKYLEPLYNDNRKLRRQNRSGQFELIHMDEFIDELLREERVCDIILPRIQKRHVLEENNELPSKVSALDLDDDMEEDYESSDAEVVEMAKKIEKLEKKKKKKRSRSRSVSKSRSRSRSDSRERNHRQKERKKDRSKRRHEDRNEHERRRSPERTYERSPERSYERRRSPKMYDRRSPDRHANRKHYDERYSRRSPEHYSDRKRRY